MYPSEEAYSGRFNIANLDYPDAPPKEHWQPGGGLNGPLTQETAKDYMLRLKAHIAPTIRTQLS